MKDYEQQYDEFWKDIVETDGEINIDQIKRELFDYKQLLSNVSAVYEHVTGGIISKPLTNVKDVLSLADEHYEKIQTDYFKDELRDLKERMEDGDEDTASEKAYDFIDTYLL